MVSFRTFGSETIFYCMQNSKIVVTCSPEIAPILADEINALGYTNTKIGKLEVSLEGSLQDCMRLNMYLRTANRVLYLVKGFKAANPDQLYDELRKIAWEQWLPKDGYLCVTSYVKTESITNTQFAQVKVKDAIVDHMVKKTGRRPDSGPERDRSVVYLHWINEHAAIFIDTSGETIAKHGYRKIPGSAPMMENLAAATIIQSGWKHDEPFVNPMCGSGTLAIEAALMAVQKAPGLMRDNFGFMHILPYRDKDWDSIVKEAESKVDHSKKPKIVATDIKVQAIQATRENAIAAGVLEHIQLAQCDFRSTPIPPAPGTVFLNPEYGERLGEERELQLIYRQIGDFFKRNCKGYKGFVFTGNMELAKKIGLKTSARHIFFNATIECRLLEYELYEGSKRADGEDDED
jgi:23S rRNA G2445 N2-methylase RlmL